MKQSKIRQQILDILGDSDRPFSAPEIVELINKSGLKVNKTSVYRQLESMIEKEEICQCDFGEGKKRYEQNISHHHHLICKGCQGIEHVDLKELEKDLDKVGLKVSQDKKFKITEHSLEFYGFCGNCQC